MKRESMVLHQFNVNCNVFRKNIFLQITSMKLKFLCWFLWIGYVVGNTICKIIFPLFINQFPELLWHYRHCGSAREASPEKLRCFQILEVLWLLLAGRNTVTGMWSSIFNIVWMLQLECPGLGEFKIRIVNKTEVFGKQMSPGYKFLSFLFH